MSWKFVWTEQLQNSSLALYNSRFHKSELAFLCKDCNWFRAYFAFPVYLTLKDDVKCHFVLLFEVFCRFRLLQITHISIVQKEKCMWRCVVISWQGKIIFHESNEFWIELQTTIPDGQVNNSEVKATYSSFDNETILLQVVSASLYNKPFYSSLCKTCFLYQEILLWLLHILAIQLYCLHKRHRFFVPPHQSELVWLCISVS